MLRSDERARLVVTSVEEIVIDWTGLIPQFPVKIRPHMWRIDAHQIKTVGNHPARGAEQVSIGEVSSSAVNSPYA